MNKERIDRLFEILNLGNVDEDKMIQESQNFFSMEEFYNEEELEEKVGNFMQDIEKSGLIDYFLSKAKENKENECVRGILGEGFYVFISDDSILDKLIENSEEYGLEPYVITKLIDNVKDMTLLKKYAQNYKDYDGLNVIDAGNLLERIGDARIYKRMDRKLERRQKINSEIENPNNMLDLLKIVAMKDPEYVKEFIEYNEEILEECYIYGDSAVELIKAVGDPEYTIEFLVNSEKRTALGISRDKAVDLIKTVDSSKAEILEQMHEINDEVYQKLDFRLLDNKYLKLLGQDKINQISCYPEVQELVLKLNEKKLKVLAKCIDTYMHNNDTEEWTVITNEILNNISCGQYDELIENIDNLDNTDINKLIKVLQAKNAFEIKCEKDLENFELIKQQRCDKLIQSSEIGDKKLAVLEKLFGTDDGYAEILLRRYGQGIDSLPESEAKNFIKSIQMLVNCQSGEILEQIYNECEETVFIDKVGIERALKKEYAKLYNEGLFRIENAVPIGENMYSAGTDFKMIITSLGPYSGKKVKAIIKMTGIDPKLIHHIYVQVI